ncbi:hypothetical protein MA16_Dca024044 [Dendrobium catenatum]|uniref:Uncharacterized protein n=1 Tax=Dendrobium catenatum TaxID=906689 RepID=A0A2I0X7Y4_9ASPA|nr:hypothetical protein MA16_Dca024044 [Dendrobium catenatum]
MYSFVMKDGWDADFQGCCCYKKTVLGDVLNAEKLKKNQAKRLRLILVEEGVLGKCSCSWNLHWRATG